MAAELWSSLGSHGSCVPSKPRPGSLEVPWTSGPLSPSKPRPWGVGNILLLWKPEACLLWSSIVNPWGIPADSPSGSPSSKVKYKIQILESAYQSHQKKKKTAGIWLGSHWLREDLRETVLPLDDLQCVTSSCSNQSSVGCEPGHTVRHGTGESPEADPHQCRFF